MEDSTPLKLCCLCGEAKPQGDFHRKRASRDGLNSCCKKCAIAKVAARRASKPEEVADKQRAYRQANKELFAARRRAYYEANREEIRARAREKYYAGGDEATEQRTAKRRVWAQENRDREAERLQQKRARRRGLTAARVDLDSLWDGQCSLCGQRIDEALTYPEPMSRSIDHIIPLSRGGTHSQDNLQWAHLVCNLRKGARLPD